MPLISLLCEEFIHVVIFLGGLICIIVYGALQHKKRHKNKLFLKETDDVFAGHGFESLKREEFNEHKKTLFVKHLFEGQFAEFIDFHRCYKKTAGEVEFYLSDVQEYRYTEGQRKLTSGNKYWNFYCAVPTSINYALAIHHKERCMFRGLFGSRLEVLNSVEGFEKVFIVKSLDKEIKEISIPVEIQKILMSYKDQYPIVSSYMQKDRAYVLLGKNEISVTAPFTDSSGAVVSLFELGAELVEYYKEKTLHV